jgi:hypothetical protein
MRRKPGRHFRRRVAAMPAVMNPDAARKLPGRRPAYRFTSAASGTNFSASPFMQ